MRQPALVPLARSIHRSIFMLLALAVATFDGVAQQRPRGKIEMFDFEILVAATKGNPARFSFLGGGGSLNLMIHEAAKDGGVSEPLRKRFEDRANQILAAGAAGFGEIAVHHLALRPGHPYESVPADHPLLLTLANIAASHDAIIDLHFDPVAEDIRIPAWGSAFDNPAELRANLAAFERLLEHNRKARIVWAHAGSDMLGFWTPELTRWLLAKHANLHMSLRVDFGRAPQNHPVDSSGRLKTEWLELFTDFPDRFVIGGDQFIFAPGPGGLPGFAQRAPRSTIGWPIIPVVQVAGRKSTGEEHARTAQSR